VIIRGDGVAAYCCAYLLNQAGFRVELESVDRPRLPVILLGDLALALVRDIFAQPEIFADAPRIRKRIVAWGADGAPVSLEHSAVLVSERDVLSAIRPPLATGGREFDWTILAAQRTPAGVGGSLTATVVAVTLKPSAGPDTCWIESLEQGWLFLTPGWLLSVGAPAEALLAHSRVVSAQIGEIGPARGTFPCSARIASPLGSHGWLACGSAAMAFDPICGDGTATAIREAILASAVIRAIAGGGNEEGLLAHYHARMIGAFHRHLLHCRQFYSTGGTGSMWQAQVQGIDRQVAWCQDALNGYGQFRYQLRGFELEAVR